MKEHLSLSKELLSLFPSCFTRVQNQNQNCLPIEIVPSSVLASKLFAIFTKRSRAFQVFVCSLPLPNTPHNHSFRISSFNSFLVSVLVLLLYHYACIFHRPPSFLCCASSNSSSSHYRHQHVTHNGFAQKGHRCYRHREQPDRSSRSSQCKRHGRCSR